MYKLSKHQIDPTIQYLGALEIKFDIKLYAIHVPRETLNTDILSPAVPPFVSRPLSTRPTPTRVQSGDTSFSVFNWTILHTTLPVAAQI
jgi:hypothetical protein